MRQLTPILSAIALLLASACLTGCGANPGPTDGPVSNTASSEASTPNLTPSAEPTSASTTAMAQLCGAMEVLFGMEGVLRFDGVPVSDPQWATLQNAWAHVFYEPSIPVHTSMNVIVQAAKTSDSFFDDAAVGNELANIQIACDAAGFQIRTYGAEGEG